MKSVLANSKSLDDSIRALHKWVAQDIRYVAVELGRGGYVPRTPETVVRTGFGDCKDKAMLFLAALRKIGVTGYPVLLNISGAERKETPSLGQFNHMSANKPENKDIINARVKFREAFRPFCPSLLWERKEDYLENARDEFFMNIGAGASIPFVGLRTFIEARYHRISRSSSDGGSRKMVLISVGVKFR